MNGSGGAAAGPPAAANIQGSLHRPTYLGDDNGRHHKKKKRKKDEFGKAEPRTLYIFRPMENGSELIEWAKSQGFKTTLPDNDLHVTVAFSRRPVDWDTVGPADPSGVVGHLVIPAGSARSMAQFGDAVVLRFTSPDLARRHTQILNIGATWDFPEYQPHITITYDGSGVNLDEVVPFEGPIILGMECMQEVKDDWKDGVVEKMEQTIQPGEERDDLGMRRSSRKQEDIAKPRSRNTDAISKDWTDDIMEKVGARHSKADIEMLQTMHDHSVKLGAKCQSPDEEDADVEKNVRIVKVDENLGMVFGYAIVCKYKGEDYYDLNIDPSGKRVPEHIPETTMLKAAADFMQNSRAGNEMHSGPDKGTYLFAFPLTSDIAKSLGIESRITGLLVGFKPPTEMLEKFKDGTYKGFSIEGRRISVEEIE